MKRKPNEEVFKDGDKHYVLAADFGFLVAVNSCGRDVSMIFTDLANGLMPPEDIRNVLVSCFRDVEDDAREEIAEDLINRYGLQECAIMASVMLSHAMIGDVKKSQIAKREEMHSVIESLMPTQSTNLKKLGLLLAATSAISTALVCGIFKILDLPI